MFRRVLQPLEPYAGYAASVDAHMDGPMSWFLIPVVVVGAILLFFVWANRKTAEAHARFQAKDVEEALTEFVSPHAEYHDTWDLFLAWLINDDYLESIRQRCLIIVRECPARHAREDISPEGLTRVRVLLKELRARDGAAISSVKTPTA